MKNCLRLIRHGPRRCHTKPTWITHNRWFSSLSLQNVRTSYEHFSPVDYQVIKLGDGSGDETSRLTQLESDLLVIPIFHDCEDSTPQMIISSESSKDETATQESDSTPLNVSRFFDFETVRLNQAHGNILTKLLSESQLLKKESKFKYVVARICGPELPYSYPKKIAVVSLGKNDSDGVKTGNNLVPPSVQQIRGLSTIVNSLMKENKSFKSCAVYVPSHCSHLSTQSLVESLNLCNHVDDRFKMSSVDGAKNNDTKNSNKYAVSIVRDDSDSNANSSIVDIKRGECISSGVCFARELVNSPANVMTPKRLASSAQSLQSDFIDVSILDEQQCADLNMYAYLSVGTCSNNAPRFIHMNLTAPNAQNSDDKQKIVLIGKGVCFDSGGYNLKAGAGSLIEMMKYDMAGSAAVIGSFAALSTYLEANPVLAEQILSKYEIHGCVAACENMISGKETSMHPGDVIQSAEGLTIEVTNTDAEGRLTLADAIWYARHKLDGDVIIDLATLTGAIKVATGKKIAGLFCNSDALATDLLSNAYSAGERLWRMPLFDDCAADPENTYMSIMDSDIADLKNSEKGGNGGGAITAALFLKKFAESTRTVKKIPQWAHLDIAGPVWSDKKGHEQCNVGGTGYGVRTLTNYVLNTCM